MNTPTLKYGIQFAHRQSKASRWDHLIRCRNITAALLLAVLAATTQSAPVGVIYLASGLLAVSGFALLSAWWSWRFKA